MLSAGKEAARLHLGVCKLPSNVIQYPDSA